MNHAHQLNLRHILVGSLLATGLLVQPLLAEDVYFRGPTGAWWDPDNWSTGSLPTENDTAWILHFDERDRWISLNGPISVGTLMIGNTGGGLTTFIQNFDITSQTQVLGIGQIVDPFVHYVPRGQAIHIQQGGTNNVGHLLLADYNSHQTPSTGTYILNSGTLIGGGITVGQAGHGFFEQNGGYVNAGLIMTSMHGAHSVYTLNAGTLITPNGAVIGHGGGNATFTHNGGLHITSVLALGRTSPSQSDQAPVYYLNGAGAILQAERELIGRHTRAAIIQSAGLHEVSLEMIVGEGNAGTYSISGGSLNVAGRIEIGHVGRGTFEHSGGVVTVGTPSIPAHLGVGSGTWGWYHLTSDSASLTVWGTEYVGRTARGIFNHHAGTHVVSESLHLGRWGTQYNLDSGTLSIGQLLDIGSDGTATFTQAGGYLNVPTIKLGSGGTFLHNGGTLNVGTVVIGGLMQLAPGLGQTLNVTSLSIADPTDSAPLGGRLDLADNALRLEAANVSLEQVRGDLFDGHILSSLADLSHRLGYGIDGADPSSDAAASGLLITFALAGDANLDGQVDVDDLQALAESWGSAGFWADGDFDYNGLVELPDLQLLAYNWQGNDASLGDALTQLSLPVVVPEPGVLGVLGLLGMLSRKRTAI